MDKIEQQLLTIWEEVLRKDGIGLDDSFFTSGGTSIKVIQLHDLIYNIYPDIVEITDIFTYPSISELANVIRERQAQVGAEDTRQTNL